MSGRSTLQALLGLCLTFLASAALGADYVEIQRRLTPEQMHATGLDMLSEQQLELLNRLLRDSPPAAAEATPASAVAPAPIATPAATPAPVSTVAAPTDESPGLLLQNRPIRARVQGTVGGWEPGTVFVLDNGQRWRVLKGRAELREPLQSPEILVVSGLAGRYFLQVHEDLPKARVYRID